MVAVLAAALLAASPPPRLASVDWVVTREDASLGSFYGDALAQALRRHGVEVVTPQELAVLVGQERQKTLLGCDADTSCLTELTNAVGCTGTLVVNLTKLDSTLTANLKVLSARDGRAVVETRAEADGERAFLARLEEAASVVADQLIPSRSGARQRATGRAVLISGAVVAALGGAALGVTQYQASVVTGELGRAHEVTPAAVQAANVGAMAQVAGWSAVALGAVAAGVGLGVMLTAPETAPVKVGAAPLPGGGVVTLEGSW